MNTVIVRSDKAANYAAIYADGKTVRFYIDENKPMTKPLFPEFADVSITSVCHGNCPYCYQNSLSVGRHCNISDIDAVFGWMTQNHRPFQVAIGGGEPMEHPQFIEILKKLRGYGISPNYTTNGTLLTDDIIKATVELCDGVAVSIHEHLDWIEPAKRLAKAGVKVNLHYVLGDFDGVEKALRYYNDCKDFFYKFILLPYTPVGRAKEKPVDLAMVVDIFGDTPDVGFGAGFYEALKNSNSNVSLYEPEMFSAYIDLVKRVVKPSSFDQGAGQPLDEWINDRKK